jgi:hypothetical protein
METRDLPPADDVPSAWLPADIATDPLCPVAWRWLRMTSTFFLGNVSGASRSAVPLTFAPRRFQKSRA